MRFFGILFAVLLLCSIVLGVPVVADYIETGLVPKFPTAILAASMATLAFIFLTCGIIVDSVSRARREVRKLCVPPLRPAGRLTRSRTSRASVRPDRRRSGRPTIRRVARGRVLERRTSTCLPISESATRGMPSTFDCSSTTECSISESEISQSKYTEVNGPM